MSEPTYPSQDLLFGLLALQNGLIDEGELFATGRAEEVEVAYRNAETPLVELAPAVDPGDTARSVLANCQTNMADVFRRSGKLNNALAACERALAIREPLAEAHPEVTFYRAHLGETYLRLGQVRSDMRNSAGAVAAWKLACENFDANRFQSGELVFCRACCHACLAGLAGRPGSGVSTADGPDQAEKALAALRQAVALGYRNSHAFRTESALDPVRNRSDFRALILDLVFPVEPFAK